MSATQEIGRVSDFLQRAGALLHAGRAADAVQCLRSGVERCGDSSGLLYALGLAQQTAGDSAGAMESYRSCLALNPNQAEAYNNLGTLLEQTGHVSEALDSFESALRINPRYARALSNRGQALHRAGRMIEAVEPLERAVTLAPDYAAAHANLGHVLSALGRDEEALRSYERARLLQPHDPYVLSCWINARMRICAWQDIASVLEQFLSALDSHPLIANLAVLLVAPTSARQQRRCAEAMVAARHPRSATTLWTGERYAHSRLRIGYFSADFHEHATSYLAAGLFEQHDRSRFEIVGFSCGPQVDDPMRSRLRAAFDRFEDVASASDREIATLARSLELDIAVDLKGFTENSRLGVFALRPAPIQVAYLGYPGTTGADYIDYLVADDVLVPERDRGHYSEKIAYLPDTYQVNDSKRAIVAGELGRRELGLPEQGFVFCNFNSPYKITPDVFEIWMRLLRQVRGSTLWLYTPHPPAAENLRAAASASGIEPERLVFAGKTHHAAHLARQQLADLFLDTFYCNAHTTASDALWAGLPLLTCRGATFAGRVASSLLTAIGVPDLIAESPSEYEHKALQLALEPVRLREIRMTLHRNRLTHPLFDTQLFTRHLEDAYTQMRQRHAAGLAPDHIFVRREPVC